MLQRIRKLRVVEAGFTLIELLIVVVILGVLAGIVVFAVQAFNGDGVQAACKADMKNVETASEAYYAKNGSYAGTLAALVPTYLKEQPPDGTATSDKYKVTYANANPPTIAGLYQGTRPNFTTDCNS